MTVAPVRATIDPIMAEIFRTRLDAIGQEAGAAIEKTAISPIVTEAKDYSISIFSGAGDLLHGTGVAPSHFGAAIHAVRSTISRHGSTVAPGDVFIANDPHSDGGLHPQDVVVQQPVFVGNTLVGWVAISAHMLDMGGMVPGSSATKATECYQEALRFPSVRLFRQHDEVEDIWAMFRTNVRAFEHIEMDMRSLVVGCHVAEGKLCEFAAEVGLDTFVSTGEALDAASGVEFRRRLAMIESGTYRGTAWVEVDDELHKVPCVLRVEQDTLTFDLRDAPPQIPHFVNSKPYIVRARIVPALHGLLALDLPLTQSLYDAVRIETVPGSIVDSLPPAPVGQGHMDCCLAVAAAAVHCVQLAVTASPGLTAPITAALYDAQGTTRWSFTNADGTLTLFTLLDGATGGTPAGVDRDGLDLNRDLAGQTSRLELADVEVLESIYPLLFHHREFRKGPAGAGRHRSGAGCSTTFEVREGTVLNGQMTGTRGWFPSSGTAGGRPGAKTSFRLARADNAVADIGMHASDVVLRAGQRFVIDAPSGGGVGDPVDRDPAAVAADVASRRISRGDALDVYGVVLGSDELVDDRQTDATRAAMLADRLRRAQLPSGPVRLSADPSPGDERRYLFPGVLEHGRLAVSERSGAVLAVAPGDWTEGCAVLDEPYASTGPLALVLRSYLDPLTGHALQAEIVPTGEGRSFGAIPDRWVRAAD